MNATMSVDDYRREVRDPAIKEQEEFDPWLRKIGKLAKADAPKRKQRIIVGIDLAAGKDGYKIVLGKNTLESFNGLKDPDKPKRQHIEDDHTEMVAGYLELLMIQRKVVEYTHTANETYTKSPMQKARNTRMGVRSGIPDMVVVFPRAILFLELKRPDGGVVSESQKRWIEAIRRVGGPVWCEVAYGYDEAKDIIDRILLTQTT